MFSCLSLAAFLLLASSGAHATAPPCLCSSLRPAGLKVNCSFLNLMALTRLPADTAELHVRDSQLTSVPAGLFDGLTGLEQVSLSGNPFHCDCRIQYLRNWLLKNRAIVSEEPICASPSSVARKAVTELSDDYFSSCGRVSHADGIFNMVVGAMLVVLIVLLLWTLRLARMSSITLEIVERHSEIEPGSLRPRHRRGGHTGKSEVSQDSFANEQDLDRPLIDMELLPQVLEALDHQHSITINLHEGPLHRIRRTSKHTTSYKWNGVQ